MRPKVLVLSIALGLPIGCHAAEPEHDLEELVQIAKSGAEHEFVAAQYETQARDMLARAQWHERTGLLYQGMEHATGIGPGYARHCEALARNLSSAARESEEIAKLHRELAAQAKQ